MTYGLLRSVIFFNTACRDRPGGTVSSCPLSTAPGAPARGCGGGIATTNAPVDLSPIVVVEHVPPLDSSEFAFSSLEFLSRILCIRHKFVNIAMGFQSISRRLSTAKPSHFPSPPWSARRPPTISAP